MKTLLSLGHGYCADALATRLLAQGWRVIGTTRDPDKAQAMAARGIEPLLWPQEPTAQAALATAAEALSAASHVLHSASPVAGQDPFLALLPAMSASGIAWMGYLSTTGVYGDTRGAWVDEQSPVAPARARSGQRVRAEAAWLASGLPVQVFRLAGIYGPGRGPFEKIRNGTALRIVKPGQVFSRVHVADVAQVLEASIARPRPGAIYNVCDDLPASAADVLSYAASLLGLPEPPSIAFEEADLGPMARSFYEECRRVCNALIKSELGVQLRYCDYRLGLQSILASQAQ